MEGCKTGGGERRFRTLMIRPLEVVDDDNDDGIYVSMKERQMDAHRSVLVGMPRQTPSQFPKKTETAK